MDLEVRQADPKAQVRRQNRGCAARLASGLFTACLNETLDANAYPSFPMN
jgi:hypothetical protein